MRLKTKRNRKQYHMLIMGITLLLGTSFTTVHAEDMTEPIQDTVLDPVVVTANRIPTKRSDTAANVTVISSDQIAANHYASLAEVLRQVNGIVVTEASMTRQDLVRIDGDDRVLVMIDGRRMNMDKGASSNRASIDLKTIASMKNIERIEIVKGAGSALYGSDAVGGVINIITKKGKAVKAESTLDMSVGSWGTRNYDLTNQGSQSDWSWFVTAGWQNQDYMKYNNWKNDATTRMGNSDYTKENGTIRLDKKINDASSLTFNYEHMTDDAGQWNEAAGYTKYGLSANYLHDRMTKLANNAAFTYHYKENTVAPSYLRYYQNYTTQGFNEIDGRAGYSRYSNKMIGFDWQDNWLIGQNHVVAGTEWHQTKIDNGALSGGDYSDKQITNKAVYLEDTVQLSDHLTFVPGIRYDNHSMFGGHTTPKAALNYKIDPKTNMYVSWGRIFNAPNADDLFWHDPYGYMLGNPNLQPETGYKTTIGINRQFDEKTAVSLSAFESKIHNAIGWVETDPTNYIYEALNANEQKKRGIEFTVNHKWSDKWSVDAAYSYIKTETKSSDNYNWDQNNSSPNGYNFGVHYHDVKWDNAITVSGGSGRSLQYFTASNYWIWNANANYKITDAMTAYIKVDNLTNKAYEMTGNKDVGAYPMSGRFMEVGVKYTF